MNDSDKVSVIIPAYNEGSVIRRVITGIKETLDECGYSYEIIVIDDGSKDNTAEESQSAGATVYCRPYNIGNGAAVKLGILKATGDYIVLMDGDGQHDPRDIPRFLENLPKYDLVVGARTRESEGEVHRNLANVIYNLLASYVVGYKVEDLTSGFRAFNGNLVRKIAYLFPNGYSYPSTSTIAVFRLGFGVRYIPIKADARVGKSKIKLLRDGIRFLFIILRIGTFFAPSRIFLPLASLVFFPGLVYAILRLIDGKPWTLPIVISVTGGILFYVLGLISEQIASLRLSRYEQ